jgi:hypothetical protein
MASPGARSCWAEIRDRFNPEFAAFIDELSVDSPSLPPLIKEPLRKETSRVVGCQVCAHLTKSDRFWTILTSPPSSGSEWIEGGKMSTADELMRRIHEAINRSMAERLRQAETIRTLQAEIRSLQRQLSALTAASSGRTNGIHCAKGMEEGGEHVVFSDNGASVQVRR